jgi:hypothetical protein
VLRQLQLAVHELSMVPGCRGIAVHKQKKRIIFSFSEGFVVECVQIEMRYKIG